MMRLVDPVYETLSRSWHVLRRRIASWRVILILALLLIVTLVFQANENYVTSRFAKPFPPQPINTDVTVAFTYPQHLRVDPWTVPGRPLTAQMMIAGMVQPSITASTITYTLIFTNDGNLVFTHMDGSIVSPRMSFTSSASFQSQQTLYVRPVPLSSGIPETVRIGVSVVTETARLVSPPTYIATLAPISVERPLSSGLRFFLSQLFGDIALPLTFALAVAGWMIDNRHRQQEQINKERHDQIQAVRLLANHDAVKAVRELSELKQRAEREQWEAQLQGDLETVRSWLEKDHQYQENLLREISEAVGRNTGAESGEILKAIEEYFPDKPGALLKPFSPMLTGAPMPVSTADTLVDAAFKLWGEYDENVRKIVVQSLEWVKLSRGGMSLRVKFENNPNNRRLLRDIRLRDVAPDLAQYWYEWPSIWSEQQVPNDVTLSKGLSSQLSCNPFTLGVTEPEQMLLRTWAQPKGWEGMLAAEPTIVLGSTEKDIRAAALVAYHEFRSAAIQRVFPVWLTLEEMWPADSPFILLMAIARAVGNAWMSILPSNPNALFDLPLTSQSRLAELLAWSIGSPQALQLWLRRPDISGHSRGRLLIRRCIELLGVDYQMSAPTEEKLLAWSRIRPLGLVSTYVFVCNQHDGSAARMQLQGQVVVNLAERMAQVDVILKLFMAPVMPRHSPELNTVILMWDSRSLEKTVRARIALCSTIYNNFSDLFGPSPPIGVGTTLVTRARGSLGQLLDLGNAVIRAHDKRDPYDPHLDQADLMMP